MQMKELEKAMELMKDKEFQEKVRALCVLRVRVLVRVCVCMCMCMCMCMY